MKKPVMKNNFYIEEDYGVIEIVSRGDTHKCIVDTEDLDFLKEIGITWCLSSNGYAYGGIPGGKGKKITLHRLLAGATNKSQITDHINHIKLDNRRSNLRIVTHCENNLNKGVLCSHNNSGCTGVHWHTKRGKWVSTIEYQKKKRHLGYFDALEDAIIARKSAEKELEYND